MATRERPGDRGRRRATEGRVRLVADIRRARVGAGLSLRAQAVDRKIALKRRDELVDHVILLVADTPRNRRALAAARSAFADMPLRTREILVALRAGVEPSGSGVVLL